MEIVKKVKHECGMRTIYLFGIRIFSYFSKKLPYWVMLDIMKNIGIKECKNEIENIVLGSSHARHGFIPDVYEYNLGGSSQDLYTSYKLYEWILKNDFKNLKNIILFYSPFSPGFQLCKTSEAWKCIAYKTFYNIDFQSELPEDAKYLEKKLPYVIKNKKCDLPENYRGEVFYSDKNGFIDIAAIAKRWIKHNRRNNNQNLYLEKLIEKSNANNHNLYIVIAPLRKDLKLLLPDKEIIFSSLYKLTENHSTLKLIDLYNSEDFDVLDFEDTDHMSYTGAKKLTGIIKGIIDTIER